MGRAGAAYRVVTTRGANLYLKLRRGGFDLPSVALPHHLSLKGIGWVIAPVPTHDQQLQAALEGFTLAVYPFTEGRNAFECPLSESQWLDFGAALRQLHVATVPDSLGETIPRETYGPRYREQAQLFLEMAERETFEEPVARELGRFLRSKDGVIRTLLRHAEELAAVLERESPAFVICHGDIHAANVLIARDGPLYVVDWDTLVLAPKERDLMFIGAGVGGVWTGESEERLFYQGYGPTTVNRKALDYYRCERVVEDIVAYSEQLLLTDGGGRDREPGLGKLIAAFERGNVVEVALNGGSG